MSEQRFEFYSDDLVIGVLDTVTGRTFNSFEIVDCLNEQQELIEEQNNVIEESSSFIIEQRKENKTLKEENEQLKEEYKIAIGEMITDYKKLENENRELRQKLDFYLLDEFEWKEKYGD